MCNLHHISFFTRTLCAIMVSLVCHGGARAQNYIRYHQQSLVVQQFMADRDTTAALTLLGKLEKKYGLMPTETYARALCEFTIGDTASARRSYVESFRQRAPIGWIFTDPPFKNIGYLYWYRQFTDECLANFSSQPQYVDGPMGTIPTVATRANQRFQFFLDSTRAVVSKGPLTLADSLGWVSAYAKLVEYQTITLDSILTGKLPFPSIAEVGVNSEFWTLVLHSDSGYTYAHRSEFLRLLEKGLVYPRTYTICFDRRRQLSGKPLAYGIFNCLRPDELAPGYEKRRAAIGMGGDCLDGARFHWSLSCNCKTGQAKE
ncbi:MAG: hypothetical protein JST45_04015 [Bacteroidetes bacterium]|nr:hypothetical protein [Bacteroidota bacterium]